VETPHYISELRIVGGNLALDFVNTTGGEPDRSPAFECLQSYADLVAWANRVGVISDAATRGVLRSARKRISDAGAMYEHALTLRAELYELFRAIAQGRRAPSRNVEALREAQRDALARASLVPGDGRYEWKWSDPEDLGGVVWPMVHAATELVTSKELHRIKACAGCRWLFLDTSRNRKRRWCTMESCGTHEKTRRYIARRAAAQRAARARRT
jgi:predicted RNA-binding Zn ribbon-like protein